VFPIFGIYRTYPGYPIELPLAASDPDRSPLTFSASDLPSGASLESAEGVFRWQPAAQQLGPFYVPVTVNDDGAPPLAATGQLTFKVQPPDACVEAICDPGSGCQSTLLPVEQACCAATSAERVAEPAAGCPQGRVLFVGRNLESGFGRMQNCDRFRVINFGQIGATVRFHVEARCLNTHGPVLLQSRLATAQRILFEADQDVNLNERDDGFAQRLGVAYPVLGPGPFFEFEGADANLAVTLTDVDGVVVSTQLRLVLTFSAIDDLPDLAAPEPP
jgi:hypothetical protein